MSSEDSLPNIFKDLHVSVFSKAVNISSNLNSEILSNTLKNDLPNLCGEHGETKCNRECLRSTELMSPSIKFSTPLPDNNGFDSQSDFLSNNSNICGNVTQNVDPQLIMNKTPENFTSQKLLYLCDLQRHLTVEKVMMERIQNMYETAKVIHNSLEHLKQAKLEEANAKWLLLEQKILDDIQEQEIKNRPKREAQLAEDKRKNSQRVLERIQKIKDSENEARKKAEAIQMNQKRQDLILQHQAKYLQLHKDIMALVNSYENKSLLMDTCDNILIDLKNYSNECQNLFKKCKTAEITEDDVAQCVKLVELIKQIHKKIEEQIKAIDEAQKLKEEKQNVKEQKEMEESVVVDSSQKSDPSDGNGLSDCFDSASFQTYFKLKELLETFDQSCKALLEDVSMKKFRFNCQKAVTLPVNAISPISSSHLSDKYMKLHNLLSGKVVDVGGIQVSAAQHPSGIPYCKKLLAKTFVRQGDLTVSSKPDAAFSIAAVLSSLWIDFPDFGQLVLAYFQRACPYLAPVFLPQIEGQSTEEYHKSLGYHYNDNGEVEKQDSFLRRMSGIMRLYCAVIISKVHQPGRTSPLGIAEGWRWMSAILNLEPRPDICATLLFDFLEVAGNEMLKVYGTQFKKLLAYICHLYFPKLEKVTPASSGGPIMRLEAVLQKIMKNGSIPPPDGLLPPNFW